MAVTIQGVDAGSAAERAGLGAGMQLLQLDGHPINDGLDYEFYSPPARLQVQYADTHGAEHSVTVEKDEYAPLGCTFGSYLIDAHHRCRNGCVFCFIDQLPKGLRDSLYFKDDDERLGFLFGNYVTLTNLGEREIQRIIDMHITPVNVSVHTANPALRVEMMRNKDAGDVLAYLPRLAAAGIALNTQLVLCPGLNDGPELRRSIEWLAGLRPAMQSIAAVPVGLSRHREGLTALNPYTPESAAEQLDIMLGYGEQYLSTEGVRLVYPSDEWFLLAGRAIPQAGFYEGYPQLENGVGMWRLFADEFTDALEDLDEDEEVEPGGVDIATGMLAAPLIENLCALLQERWPQVSVRVHAVENRFFGTQITVAGLLTGQDVLAAMQTTLESSRLLLPANMLRAEGDLFLDGMSPTDLENQLDADVEMVPCDGAQLLYAILNLPEDE